MGPVLLKLVFLLGCVPAINTCLQCDNKIKILHEDFILSAPSVIDQIELKKICDHAYNNYREKSLERRGVIDRTTLYRASTEYQSEFDRFLKTRGTGSLTQQMIQIMEKGSKILEKHLDIFSMTGLCPNKCGLLYQRVMDCSSCVFKTYNCFSSPHQQDCGEHTVQGEEGDQAVLDCYLPWHRLVFGRPAYHYSWSPGVPGTKKLKESDFRGLVVTADSFVVLNQLHVDEQGTYRCSLQDRRGTVFSQVTFLLTVRALPTETQRPLFTLPVLPHGGNYSSYHPTDNLGVPVIATVTALSLAASVGLIVALGKLMSRGKKREKHTQRDGMTRHV